jgi:CDP-diacylglycerol--glycerol-3-phosphate 3-phosphatidyltransferase
MNLANKITLVRIFLVPVVVIFMLGQFDFGYLSFGESESISYSEIIAALFFILAASTDGLDGYIARKRKIITTLGKFLDP